MITNFIGFHCPSCGTKIGTAITGESQLLCPNCKTTMVPDQNPLTATYTNMKCKKCGTVYGYVLSNNCACGEPFE